MPIDPLRTRLCEEYGCEVPVAGFSLTREVAAAISNAGGIGVLGASTHTPEELRTDLRWLHEHIGERPFGVNLTLPASVAEGNREDLEVQIPQEHRDFVARMMRDAGIAAATGREAPPPGLGRIGSWRLASLADARTKLDIMFEGRVPIFVSGLGSPAFILERAHAAGTRVWGLVGLARQARRELESGVDLIIAQGTDAGGHCGPIGTFSLVPEVAHIAAEFDRPVLAAGGVTTGKHLAAALALGADGAWTGTAWSATTEAATDPVLKAKLLRARSEDAWLSSAYTGKPSRRLRDPLLEAWERDDAPRPLPMPLQDMLIAPLTAAIIEHHVEDWLWLPAGQGAGWITESKPTAEVLSDLVTGARAAFGSLAGN